MKKLFLVWMVSWPLLVLCQTEATIRTHYTDVNKRIQASDSLGFEGPLYKNQWVSNKNGRSWPAVGLYNETVDFWYDDPPDHLPAEERNPKNVLLKIHIVRQSSHLHSNEEYLFKDGKLLFYFSKEGEEGNEWQTRVYYNTSGVAFKSSVRANGKELSAKDFLTEEFRDFKPNPAGIMTRGKKWQELFLKSM